MYRLIWILTFCFLSTFVKSEIKSPEFVHYTNEDGLPSSYVKSIKQDADGFMWFATRATVTRFDGQAFKEFPAYNTSGGKIKIFGDKLYLAFDSLLITRTINQKYYYFDSYGECFRPYNLLNQVGSALSVVPTDDGFWICKADRITFLDASTGVEEPFDAKYPFVSFAFDMGFNNLIETPEVIVILTNGRQMLVVDKNRQRVKYFDVPDELGTQPATLFFVDSGENVWLGMYEYGLVRFRLSDGNYQMYSKKEESPYYLPHNLVHCVTEDEQGRIWIGSEDGLAIYDLETGNLTLHSFDLHNPTGLNSNPIYDAFCDAEGNIWLGTYFGGINFWSNKKNFFRTWSPGLGNGELRGNVVSCLTEDGEGDLWIGLEDNGLNKFDRESGEIIHYAENKGPAHLSYNNLHDLLFVSEHELWIATYTGGINILNTKTNEIKHLNPDNTKGLLADAIYSFLEAGDSIYISTSQGIIVHNKVTGTFSPLKPDQLGGFQFESIAGSTEKLWFTSFAGVYGYIPATDSLFTFDRIPEMKNINFVKTDSRGNVWFGDCYKGLCRYNEERGDLKFFNNETGFPVSWVFSLEEGDYGWFWASSDKGLVRFSPDEDIYILYDSNSGIPFNQFNYRASYIDSGNNIYFGGNNGMISFNEERPWQESDALEVKFTGMKLFNEEVLPGEYKRLEQSLNKSEKIVLDYDQNVLTIEYAALAYSSIGSCQYAYYLEGFEDEWNFVGTRNFATYTNLSPGKYTFHVKASLGDIRNSEEGRILEVVVQPPWWLTKVAFVSYLLFVLFFLALVLKVGKNIEKSRALLMLERREREHEDEIHRVKLDFFTNISHELKTPLTLIIGPLSRLMVEEKMNPALKKGLTGIERNANRLFHLIHQLLEFRKIETGKDQLKVSQLNIVGYTNDIAESFTELADSRDIEFVVNTPDHPTEIWFDGSKVDKIMLNLLSNAFKFTDGGGRIELYVNAICRGKKSENNNYDLVIRVSDTGKGIAPELIDKVFDRFFQVDDEHSQSVNSGIGLAYVKSLVMFHRGRIEVKSKLGTGSVFTVTLPVSKSDFSEEEILIEKEQVFERREDPEIIISKAALGKVIVPTGTSLGKPKILLVEDNIELVRFLVEILEDNYNVEYVYNGREALEKLHEFTPNLIISDIMMPEMDGITFTKTIKTDLKTSHIPVVLLTSKTGVKNELEGLMTGADYFIGKPFFPEMLTQVIDNILKTQQRIIERFREDSTFTTRELGCSESDKNFIEKLTNLVKKHLNSEQLDVTFLINEISVSRSLLHKKLKGIVGCSATEFIRIIRLKEAEKLISSGKCNITEASYETGFSSPAYFTRCFKEFYGQSPRDYFKI
ncbi:hybrid sensor histidine kinase/response regulator transcription factor [Marinilabilia sp.]|uniref:hybrid sensor histidine kinase/response regulator transcription factor n=1 Tax=Marinilabilia sp. TaxID=2021252 RepID=UPI0025BD3262|nr:hybrid sensor histidine kinase/response regulator transcription factor [Marinilabilia sp.]